MPGLLLLLRCSGSRATGSNSSGRGSAGDILLARLATRQRQGGSFPPMRARLYESLSVCTPRAAPCRKPCPCVALTYARPFHIHEILFLRLHVVVRRATVLPAYLMRAYTRCPGTVESSLSRFAELELRLMLIVRVFAGFR